MGRLSRLVDPESGQHQVCCGLCHCSRWDLTSGSACHEALGEAGLIKPEANLEVETWGVLNFQFWMFSFELFSLIYLKLLGFQGSQTDLLLTGLASHHCCLHPHHCSPCQNIHSVRKVWYSEFEDLKRI